MRRGAERVAPWRGGRSEHAREAGGTLALGAAWSSQQVSRTRLAEEAGNKNARSRSVTPTYDEEHYAAMKIMDSKILKAMGDYS